MAERHKAQRRRDGFAFSLGTVTGNFHLIHPRCENRDRGERKGRTLGYEGVWTQRQAQRVGRWVGERGDR